MSAALAVVLLCGLVGFSIWYGSDMFQFKDEETAFPNGEQIIEVGQMEPQHRPESGSMRFGDDWAGVFIRGDMAHAYAIYLRDTLTQNVRLNNPGIDELVTLLESCDQNQAEQALKAFEECKVDPQILGGDKVDGLAATLGNYIQEVRTMDTTKVITVIGAGTVAIAFLFVVIAPAFPNVIVLQGTAQVVFGFFGAVFGGGVVLFSHKQGSDQTLTALIAGK